MMRGVDVLCTSWCLIQYHPACLSSQVLHGECTQGNGDEDDLVRSQRN